LLWPKFNKWVQTCIAWDCEVWCVVLGLKLMKMCNKKQYIYFICTFMGMFYRSLFVLFFWPLCCLFFFDIRILITPLVSSNSSLNSNHILSSTKGSNKCPQCRNVVPRSPLHISLDLLSALHLNHGHSRASPAFW
jgi:hypothetical protein